MMNDSERTAFLERPLIATLCTLRGDGSPTAVPVWYEWDGSAARVFTGEGSGKLKRIAGDPRVVLCVPAPAAEPEAWVTIEGTASVSPNDVELVRRMANRYYGAEKAAQVLPEWEASPAAWQTITITPSRVQSA